MLGGSEVLEGVTCWSLTPLVLTWCGPRQPHHPLNATDQCCSLYSIEEDLDCTAPLWGSVCNPCSMGPQLAFPYQDFSANWFWSLPHSLLHGIHAILHFTIHTFYYILCIHYTFYYTLYIVLYCTIHSRCGQTGKSIKIFSKLVVCEKPSLCQYIKKQIFLPDPHWRLSRLRHFSWCVAG